ncbi:MAG TPA: hypothetical protein VF170_04060, partial [Planctomycetaceae bacterium]
MDGGRRRVLVAAGAALLLAAVALLVVAAVDPGRQAASAGPSGDGETSSIRGASLLLRAVDPRDPTLNGRVLVIDHGGKRAPSGTGLACQRIHFAGGRGLCLGVAPSGVDFEATIFDAGLRPLRRLALTGIPSRARVSPDGRLGAMTVFVAGHEYLGGSGFSTTTTIVDMRTGKQVAELEEFDVVRDGTRFKRPDFNFWGVTFARDPSRFYATLRTGGHHYLVEGDLDARRMEVIRDGVECPSLSPGGDRIAYKSRVDGTDRWRLRVL